MRHTMVAPADEGGELEGPAVAACEHAHLWPARQFVQHKVAILGHGVWGCLHIPAFTKQPPLVWAVSLQISCAGVAGSSLRPLPFISATKHASLPLIPVILTVFSCGALSMCTASQFCTFQVTRACGAWCIFDLQVLAAGVMQCFVVQHLSCHMCKRGMVHV
eukprot:1159699-Pelagomonas_calceolata.AAC.18